ncbi:MAG: redoxin domain-containing protein [Nitrospirae bacterium]|nr:redoxin domain-containing protein [Nitrospirota bacterium]
MAVNKGDKAPDLELVDTDGQLVQLSTLWKNNPLVLVFTRHLG